MRTVKFSTLATSYKSNVTTTADDEVGTENPLAVSPDAGGARYDPMPGAELTDPNIQPGADPAAKLSESSTMSLDPLHCGAGGPQLDDGGTQGTVTTNFSVLLLAPPANSRQRSGTVATSVAGNDESCAYMVIVAYPFAHTAV
jgi:hypothetical protein